MIVGRDHVKTFVHVFLWKTKQLEEKKRVTAILYITKSNLDNCLKSPVVCIKHWPQNIATAREVKEREWPLKPPSIFDSAPTSDILSPPPQPRPTLLTAFGVRNLQEDVLTRMIT